MIQSAQLFGHYRYGALENVDEDVIEARIHTLIDDGTIYVGQYHTLLEP